MHHRAFPGSLAIVAAACFVVTPASAAAKKKSANKPDPAITAVEKVLRSEVAGPVDRRGQLADTLKQQPDSGAARWQAGFVRDGKLWRSFDNPAPPVGGSEFVAEYNHRRDETPQTFAGQLDLANWCGKQRLPEQERAHLFAAASLAPDHDNSAICYRLGCRRIGGIWLNPEELRDCEHLNRQIHASMTQWETKLNAISNGLSGSVRQREAALDRMREINDQSVIPAIELVLAGRSEDSALCAVNAFKHFDGPSASLALVKQAVFSKWPAARKAASAALASRDLEDFVPPLIALLAKPVTAECRVYRTPSPPDTGYGGISGSVVLFFSYVLARETSDQFQVATLQAADYLINDYLDGLIFRGEIHRGPPGQSPFYQTLIRGQTDELRRAGAGAELLERTVAEFNTQTKELNCRIGAVLASVSGQESTSSPDDWWKWWRTYSDTQLAAEKRVVEVSESEVIGNPSGGFSVTIISCFAAGTPVWTESGAQAIESVKVGDRVLAKDVASGELTYKPVLQTTVRPPKELTTLRCGDEKIVCTGGHRFWSSGSGWIKARDLEPHTLLHTVTGNTPVWSAKKGTTAETYNLVVADFHTYFVGKTGVLCQDLLIPRSTDNVVPGLSRGQAIARK
jgi:hypothetical protein